MNGMGYQRMRPSRNRHYGHPNLIRFIESYAAELQTMGIPILLSDMSMPRGGPMPYGHTSHQTGLDVDIWFWSHPEQFSRLLTLEERDELPFISMLKGSATSQTPTEVDPKLFGKAQIQKLKLAALYPETQRIFLNPAIKVAVCEMVTGSTSDRAWIQKLRPWPGHDSHFHVRLRCPTDSPECIAQDAVPPGDGCDEAKEWLKKNILFEVHDDHEIEFELKHDVKNLPPACQSILNGQTF